MRQRLLGCAALAIMLVVGVLPAGACVGKPGPGPFTVVGWVTDPAGQPVAGLPLVLIPLTADGEPDLENGAFGIEEQDAHLTRTNAEGLFVMPQVYDYLEVLTHRYRVLPAGYTGMVADGSSPTGSLFLEGGVVDLSEAEVGMVKLRLVARLAGAVAATLVDATGQPFSGTRAVFCEAPGLRLVYTARFEQGRHELRGIPPGPVRVGLLDGELAYFVAQRSAHERRPVEAFLLVSGERTLVAPVEVRAGETAPVELRLP